MVISTGNTTEPDALWFAIPIEPYPTEVDWNARNAALRGSLRFLTWEVFLGEELKARAAHTPEVLWLESQSIPFVYVNPRDLGGDMPFDNPTEIARTSIIVVLTKTARALNDAMRFKLQF